MAKSAPHSNSVITVTRSTSLHDVLLWRAEDSVRFEVTRDSSFQLFAEGVALGKVSALSRSGCRIEIICNFSLKNLAQEKMGVLEGLFGIAILYNAKSCTDKSGLELRAKILEFLWRRAQAGNGVFGDGKRLNFLSRDPDYPVPNCLEMTGLRFPNRRHFVDRMTDASAQISGTDDFGTSVTEESAMTFLYESSVNAFEHGRHDNNKSIRGIRGVTVEKLVFTSLAQAHKHHVVPEMLQDYLSANWDSMPKKKMLINFNVIDLGVGIQNTTKSLAGEDEWHRFLRAFEEGVSCKKSSASLTWGQGLPRIIESGQDLRAFLFIYSAGVVATRNFSSPSPKTETVLERAHFGTEDPLVGTTVSLLWPVSERTEEQLMLDFS